ncbi:MAG: hypothetical protein J1F35_00690 [Erysipelotrichales bacterium]|nr:hypothetical protein [Erysipelotrichales bacterium]
MKKTNNAMQTFENIARLEDALYDDRINFNNFENIDKRTLKWLDEKVHEFIEINKRFNQGIDAYDNCFLYESALKFLAGNGMYSYDEKILFLIMLFDPTLSMYEMYKTYTDKPVVQENFIITSLDENDERELMSRIFKEFRFYNPFLIQCEEAFEKYYNKSMGDDGSELSTNVRVDYISQFMRKLNLNCTTLNVSGDKLNNIIELSRKYLLKYLKDSILQADRRTTPALNDLIYQLQYELDIQGIETFADKVIFIICVMDYGLFYLQCDSKCYSYSAIRNEIIDIYGTYNQALMDMEVKFGKENKHAKELIA